LALGKKMKHIFGAQGYYRGGNAVKDDDGAEPLFATESHVGLDAALSGREGGASTD
jgi:hypothetical protein